MSLRSLVTAASTIVVAFVLAIAVPVSQLRTFAHETDCCCPDPDRCKCPDHDEDRSTQSTMRACHKTSQDFVAPVLPAFVAPAIEIALAPVRTEARAAFVLDSPHPPPPPRRPDAPS